MRGHADNVLHYLGRIGENVVVDPLEDITDLTYALIHQDSISVIDVTGSIRFGSNKVSRQIELLNNRLEIVTCHSVYHSFSG